MTWLIKNRRSGKYVYGTDYRGKPRQRTSFEKAILYETREECELDMLHRRCGKDYVAKEVRICEHFGGDWCR